VVISISLVVSLILGGFDYIFTQSIGFLGQVTQVKTPVPTQSLIPITTVVPTIKLEPTVKKTK
jgi:hypothetical protein